MRRKEAEGRGRRGRETEAEVEEEAVYLLSEREISGTCRL